MDAASSDGSGGNPTEVLHVDDESQYRELVAEYLETIDPGLSVVTAGSATEGLQIIENRDVECVVSDYQMPSVDGLKFLERVRELYPQLPFVLFTGKGSEEIASDAIAAGVTAYLQKRGGREQYERLSTRIARAVEGYRARRELEATRARFRALSQHTSLAVVSVGEDSVVRFANEAVDDVFGYDPEEVVGETLTTLMPDRFEAAHFEGVQRYLQTGERALDWGWIELPGLHADGHEVPLGISFGEAETDDGPLFTGIIRDISDREERRRELEAHERRIEALLTDPSAVVAFVDLDGTISRANETAGEFADEPPSALEGVPVWEVGWCDHDGAVRDRLRDGVAAAGDGEFVEFETDLSRPDGSTDPFDVWISPVRSEDGVTELLVEARNVSDLDRDC